MRYRHLFMTMAIATLLAGPAAGSAEDRPGKLLPAAEQALRQSISAPDKGIPKELLERAECVGVFPDVKKGAFVVGGEFGRGLFTCRRADGSMGAPALFSIGGPSVGWQFGGQEADLILLIMNDGGVKHLLEDHFTLGGEISAVAGPVGRTTQAATDAQLHAQILSWSRSRGVFLGAALKGTVVKQDKAGTEALYGKPILAREILVEQKVGVPADAVSFVRATSEAARRAS
jgi:lipid-binding SYLF domain-containing protein